MRVLNESYPMNTHMTWFKLFLKISLTASALEGLVMQVPVIQNISIFAAGKNCEKMLLVVITHRLCTRLNDADPNNSECLCFAADKNCEQMLLADAAHRLCTRLNDADPSGQHLFRSVDILWNLMENGSRVEVAAQLNNLSCLRSVHNQSKDMIL